MQIQIEKTLDVEVVEGQLAELWPRIPLDDLEIANRLGISRQRVINLRSAARQRLARRLRDKEVSG